MSDVHLSNIKSALKGGVPEQRAIARIGLQLVGMLLEKNRKYGSSATHPIRVFSQLSPAEGIRIRMDDKLSRIRNGAADEDEDPMLDLAGYLILFLVEKEIGNDFTD